MAHYSNSDTVVSTLDITGLILCFKIMYQEDEVHEYKMFKTDIWRNKKGRGGINKVGKRKKKSMEWKNQLKENQGLSFRDGFRSQTVPHKNNKINKYMSLGTRRMKNQ